MHGVSSALLTHAALWSRQRPANGARHMRVLIDPAVWCVQQCQLVAHGHMHTRRAPREAGCTCAAAGPRTRCSPLMKPFAQVAALKPPPLRAMPSGSLSCLMCGMQYSVLETSGWLKGRGVPFGSRNFVVRKKRQSSVEPTRLQERKWGGRRWTRGSGMHDVAWPREDFDCARWPVPWDRHPECLCCCRSLASVEPGLGRAGQQLGNTATIYGISAHSSPPRPSPAVPEQGPKEINSSSSRRSPGEGQVTKSGTAHQVSLILLLLLCCAGAVVTGCGRRSCSGFSSGERNGCGWYLCMSRCVMRALECVRWPMLARGTVPALNKDQE